MLEAARIELDRRQEIPVLLESRKHERFPVGNLPANGVGV
jgi:hypothetical protein